MANVIAPHGFTPIRNNGMYSGQTNIYFIPSSDVLQYNIGDAVKTVVGGDTNGIPSVQKSTGAASEYQRGVIVGVLPVQAVGVPSLVGVPLQLEVINVPATKTRGPGLPTRSMATLRALVTTVRSSRPRSSRMNWETVVPPVVPITRAPSTSRAGIPRHIWSPSGWVGGGRLGHVGDRLQGHLVTAGELDVGARAARAHGDQVGAVRARPAGAAGDLSGHGDELDGGVGRLGARRDALERIRQGLRVNGVPYPEPHPDRGYLAAAGAGAVLTGLLLPRVRRQAAAALDAEGVQGSTGVRWMAAAPAELASLPAKGRLAVGCDADLVAFDPEAFVDALLGLDS